MKNNPSTWQKKGKMNKSRSYSLMHVSAERLQGEEWIQLNCTCMVACLGKKSGGSTICNNPELAKQNSNDRSSNSFQFQMHTIKFSI